MLLKKLLMSHTDAPLCNICIQSYPYTDPLESTHLYLTGEIFYTLPLIVPIHWEA